MLAPGKHILLGNHACAEGALHVGCDFFAGYPITPASEISHYMAKWLSKLGGFYIQMEDEIASISAILGASWAGAKAMTATSGPGFSLMQENLSYAYMTETPCVIVNVQRSGPSTGQATLPAQQDVYQARYGAHGDYEAIVLTPWSVQEMFDLTVKAFNLSEKLRNPVILLADGAIGHMREGIIVPEKVKRIGRRCPESVECTPFDTDDPSLVPEMPVIGQGYHLLVTGSAHRSSGLRDYTPQQHRDTVERICTKIRRARNEIIEVDQNNIEDADIAVISYGVAARPSFGAMLKALDNGLKVGMLRLKTIWPFPDREIRKATEGIDNILVVEMNMGKIVREVERAVARRINVVLAPKVGGEVHTSDEIFQAIRRLKQ
ncbi:MAG: 2-oxoacid:acceptor oxidoreductase subunit alpha [Candidatus Bathyarchaeota archaeon]|nr:MAG: 2-oxoacid:acceptor oxidoreductase subunit alpha [Candidatus Bathyarchaeota archaeon]